MTDKKYNGWNDSDTRSSGVPKNEGMTKEQIEQAAKDRYPIPEYTDIDSLPHLEQCRIVEMIEFIDNERAAFIAGATSPEAKAYHGQGWVELDEKLPDDGESVWFYTPKFKKVLPGHFVKQDSFNRENVFISSDGGYYESLIVSHYMINRFPSAPNEKK